MLEAKTESKSTKTNSRNQTPSPMRPVLVLAGIALAGFLLILVYSLSTKASASVFGIATMVASASALAGGLLGFVFAIPRMVKQGEEHQEQAAAKTGKNAEGIASYQQNTNLEQISDWLTKILVGAGLTQIVNMQKWISEAGQRLAPGFGGGDISSVFAAATVLSYSFIGFLLGYLWTRLYFAEALHQTELATVGFVQQVQQEASENVEGLLARIKQMENDRDKDEKAHELVNKQLSQSMTAPKSDELDEAIRKASPAALVHILREAELVRQENWRSDKPKMERTIPVFLALARIDNKNHEAHGQLGFALKDKAKPDWETARKELNLAIELRGPWKSSPKYLAHYELARAQCQIWLDKNFRENRPSTPDACCEILADLRIFRSVVANNHKTWNDEPIQSWLKLNGLSVTDLTSETNKALEATPALVG